MIVNDTGSFPGRLDAVFQDGDPALITYALGQVAEASGLGRPSLGKTLSSEGRPEFAAVLKVIQALGLRLTVSA